MAQQAVMPGYEVEYDGTYILDSQGKKVEKEVLSLQSFSILVFCTKIRS